MLPDEPLVPAQPASAPAASSQDAEHLKLLAIFHFVYAGLIALGGCCGGVYFVMGVMMALGQMNGNDRPEDTEMIGRVMSSVSALAIVIIWSIAILVAVAGRRILQRRNRNYCIVLAGLMCLNVPVGTALGVFTLYVLVRPSVKALFDLPEPAEGPRQRRRPGAGDTPGVGESLQD
ncbi:MAG: hypothetical protein JNG89_14720 [Planctomycetaceae bacterium]|nr:hypothetical protein [Planctomycetaceae bacterium]